MSFFSPPKKIQRVFIGLLLVVSLVISVNPVCEAIDFDINIPIVGDIYKLMKTVFEMIKGIPDMMRSALPNVTNLFTTVSELAGGGKSSSLDDTGKPILASQQKDEQAENQARKQSQEINNYATKNPDTLQNSINAFNQEESAPCGEGEKCTSTNSATIQDTSAFSGPEHSKVANNFTLNSTGAHVGIANPTRPRTLEEEDLRAKAIHDVIAANQSIAGEGQSKAQARLTQMGKDNKSGRQNTKGLTGEQKDNESFWGSVGGGGISSIVTFLRGSITRIFTIASFVFKMVHVVTDILFSMTGILSVMTFITNMTIGSVTVASTAVSSSPVGKTLKKNMG